MSEQQPAASESTITHLPERRGLKKGVYLLPNLVTTGALFAGFYAIIAAMTGAFEAACIAIDTVGAGVGDQVLVVRGSAARMALQANVAPVDAAVIAIVDTITVKAK